MALRIKPSDMLSIDALFSTEEERKGSGAASGPGRAGDSRPVKKSFYLAPEVYEALRLHHMIYAAGVREYSKIVNEAIAAYLTEEMEALEEVDGKLENSARLAAAMNRILSL